MERRSAPKEVPSSKRKEHAVNAKIQEKRLSAHIFSFHPPFKAGETRLNSPSGLPFAHFRNKSTKNHHPHQLKSQTGWRCDPRRQKSATCCSTLSHGCFAISTKEDERVVSVFWHSPDDVLEQARNARCYKHTQLCIS